MFARIVLCLSLVLLGNVALAEPPRDPRDRIVGAWNSLDRHISLGSLYQPVHGVRKREGVVHIERKGDSLAGHAICDHHRAITFQERWKEGRTDFRKTEFAGDVLRFEFDIAEWRATDGPIAVEEKRIENKGTIRVEAKLEGDRLVGKWGVFTADGVEVFRGEWEAVRSKPKD